MTLQTSIKRPLTPLIDAPGTITVLAIVWLLIEDLCHISKPYILSAVYEIRLTIQNDPAYLDIWKVKKLLPVATTFTVFYALFLLIEIWR